MSTIVVVKKNGKAVIAADTLIKYGDANESAEYTVGCSKLLEVGDSHLAFVGHASFGLVLNSYFSSLDDLPRFDSRESIYQAACAMHPTLKKSYYLNPNEDEDDVFESTQFDSLICNPSGIFGLYSLRFVQEYKKFYAFGSGYGFAMGAMRAAYPLLDSVEDIAKAGLEAAADFDDGTLGPFEMKTVQLIT